MDAGTAYAFWPGLAVWGVCHTIGSIQAERAWRRAFEAKNAAFDSIVAQHRADMEPWRAAGERALLAIRERMERDGLKDA